MVTLVSWLIASGPDGGVDAGTPAPPELPSYGGLLLKTVLALGLVIVLIWILLRWGLPRLMPGSRGTTGLRLVARQPLDSRRAVVVVEAYGRYLLLGVAEGSVTLLGELDVNQVRRLTQIETAARQRSFAEVLRARFGRPSPPPMAAEAPPGDDAPPADDSPPTTTPPSATEDKRDA